jgi:hypothetical protein
LTEGERWVLLTLVSSFVGKPDAKKEPAMKKIVSINQYVNRLEGTAALRVHSDAAAACGAAPSRQERTRGILLQCPKSCEGPLTAAMLALAAVLGTLVSNVRL